MAASALQASSRVILALHDTSMADKQATEIDIADYACKGH